MKVSWRWLTDLVDTDVDVETACERLTLAGLEVEGIEALGEGFSGVLVAEVQGKKPHPDADKLTVVQVFDGEATHEVVCGAPNVPEPGGKVLWARPGARLPGGLEIGKRKIRGVASIGMICSETELGLGEDAGGIIVLQGEDAQARPGQAAQDALGLHDTVLDIGLTTNRGDCLGHIGVAREVAALCGGKLRKPSLSLDGFESETETASLVQVEIEDPAGCPRYTARVIEGLAWGPSPRWMRRRLEAVGVRPISNLVDVTNYVMFELGHPLHAFDMELLTGGVIRVRRARAGEKMVTLDEQERALVDADLLICDGKGPVALAGVMGGLGSAVSETTTRVLLEAASFDPLSIRRTAGRLALRSESSHRFERTVDPNGVEAASRRAARLLCEIAGGRAARGFVDAFPRPPAPVVLDLRPARAERVLGTRVEVNEIRRALEALELRVEGEGERLRVTVPTFRPDLEREIDLIEEIGRLVGLDGIPATLPRTERAPRASGDPLAEKTRDVLAAAGLSETITYGFTSPDCLSALRFPDGHPATRPIRLANPLREDLSVMRTSLVPNLLLQVRRNLAFGVTDVRLYEVGSVFLPSGEELPSEPRFCAGVVCGTRAGWLKDGGPVDFYDLKGVVEALARALDLTFEFSPARHEEGFLHPGVAASVSCGDAFLGVVGEVHPETRERFDIDARVFAFELNLERLPPPSPRSFEPLPRHPQVVRDVSFFVDDFVPAARVRALIEERRPPILVDVRVLEDYREEGKVPPGKKGMLWSMTYRAGDRTLTDEEVDSAHEALLGPLLAELKADRR